MAIQIRLSLYVMLYIVHSILYYIGTGVYTFCFATPVVGSHTRQRPITIQITSLIIPHSNNNNNIVIFFITFIIIIAVLPQPTNACISRDAYFKTDVREFVLQLTHCAE